MYAYFALRLYTLPDIKPFESVRSGCEGLTWYLEKASYGKNKCKSRSMEVER